MPIDVVITTGSESLEDDGRRAVKEGMSRLMQPCKNASLSLVSFPSQESLGSFAGPILKSKRLGFVWWVFAVRAEEDVGQPLDFQNTLFAERSLFTKMVRAQKPRSEVII